MKGNGKAVMMLVSMLLLVGAGFEPLTAIGDICRVVTNYPNPFDSRSEDTTIYYTLPEEADVTVKIYDLFGILVREFPSTREYPGAKQLHWDGTNDAGRKVAKGGYLCVVEITGEAARLLATRKIGVIH